MQRVGFVHFKFLFAMQQPTYLALAPLTQLELPPMRQFEVTAENWHTCSSLVYKFHCNYADMGSGAYVAATTMERVSTDHYAFHTGSTLVEFDGFPL